jgi:predicted glycosyltransferase
MHFWTSENVARLFSDSQSIFNFSLMHIEIFVRRRGMLTRLLESSQIRHRCLSGRGSISLHHKALLSQR